MHHFNVGTQRISLRKGCSVQQNMVHTCASRCMQASIPTSRRGFRDIFAARLNLGSFVDVQRRDPCSPVRMCTSGDSQQSASSEVRSATPSDPALFWSSHISCSSTLHLAIEDCITQILSSARTIQGSVQPTLAIVFVSSAYADSYDKLLPLLRQRLPSLTTIVGCSGRGVVGVAESGLAEEVKNSPALSLTLAYLPKVKIVARQITSSQIPNDDAAPDQWSRLIGVPAFSGMDLSLIMMVEPDFDELSDLLTGLDYAFPAAAKIGGYASASPKSKAIATFCWQQSDAEALERCISLGTVSNDTFVETVSGTGTDQQVSGSSSSSVISSSSKSTEQSSSSEMGALLRGSLSRPSMGGAGRLDVSAAFNASFPPEAGSAEASRIAAAAAAASAAAVAAASIAAAAALRLANQGSAAVPSSMQRNKAVILALHGGVVMDTFVAQGCRPLTGNTYTIHELRHNTVRKVLDQRGKPFTPKAAFDRELKAVCQSEEDMSYLRQTALLGLTPRGHITTDNAQDFVIRPMVGFRKDETMMVGDVIHMGQQLRFMVRDKETAIEDLALHGTSYKLKQLMSLENASGGSGDGEQKMELPFGALMFSGRGMGMYESPSVDAQAVTSFVPVPLAGFHCNGEIGQVGKSTHVHELACAVGVLRQVKVDVEEAGPRTTI